MNQLQTRKRIRRRLAIVVCAGAMLGLLAPAAAQAHSGQPQEGRSGTTGYHERAYTQCKGDQWGGAFYTFPGKIRAVNSTTARDSQRVAFRTHIQHWENGQWVDKDHSPWIYGIAWDYLDRVGSWQYANGAPANHPLTKFGIPQYSRNWRVLGETYWYATAYVGPSRDHAVSLHQDEFSGVIGYWCNF